MVVRLALPPISIGGAVKAASRAGSPLAARSASTRESLVMSTLAMRIDIGGVPSSAATALVIKRSPTRAAVIIRDSAVNRTACE
jgi:hypothetical protein